jgi:hypothetical protein
MKRREKVIECFCVCFQLPTRELLIYLWAKESMEKHTPGGNSHLHYFITILCFNLVDKKRRKFVTNCQVHLRKYTHLSRTNVLENFTFLATYIAINSPPAWHKCWNWYQNGIIFASKNLIYVSNFSQFDFAQKTKLSGEDPRFFLARTIENRLKLKPERKFAPNKAVYIAFYEFPVSNWN